MVNGAKLWIWDCDGSNNQRWYFGARGELFPMANEKMCVDLPGNKYDNGNQLELWECNGLPQQHWQYDSKMKTIYLSTSQDATKCVDLRNGGQASGTPIQIWDCITTDVNQQWDVYQFGVRLNNESILV